MEQNNRIVSKLLIGKTTHKAMYRALPGGLSEIMVDLTHSLTHSLTLTQPQTAASVIDATASLVQRRGGRCQMRLPK